ncbi:tumor necrosis factor alpha-induced protein 8-like protein isoform X1 [Watersipora subatra]|uniref:tumor necrosis factor alpha-induced protein 8-like protein isoform X1 n=1 Tax=Watersipora subatra TaxID=2589382 RepID=UPI00355B979A
MNKNRTRKVSSEPGNGFNSRGLGLRIQKKLASSMSSKSVAKVFIDDQTGQLLDNVYLLVKEYSGDKKEAERITKYLIKVTIKIAILMRNDQFNNEELDLIVDFKKKFKTLVMTVTSFVEVDFTFDKHFLSKSFAESSNMIQRLIARHSKEKTKNKVLHVFQLLGNTDFLEKVFTPDSKYSPIMSKIAKQLDDLMESGVI